MDTLKNEEAPYEPVLSELAEAADLRELLVDINETATQTQTTTPEVTASPLHYTCEHCGAKCTTIYTPSRVRRDAYYKGVVGTNGVQSYLTLFDESVDEDDEEEIKFFCPKCERPLLDQNGNEFPTENDLLAFLRSEGYLK